MPMAHVHATAKELGSAVSTAIRLEAGRVRLVDPDALRGPAVDDLAHTAVFGGTAVRDHARALLRGAAWEAGVRFASIQGLYAARGRGEVPRAFTVPALNIRGPTYDVGRAAFRAANRLRVGAVLFEIARSEIGYTDQRPGEYAASIVAAALREGFRGPVFLQGDHYQFSPSKWKTDPEGEKAALRALVAESLDAGFRNIDIDASTLVDLSLAGEVEQQRLNATLSAELCSYIREHEPRGVTVAVGGEIGEVGTHVTSVAEFEAYMETYEAELARRGRGPGPVKISINTGTAHGGKVEASGKVGKQEVRFDVIRDTGELARAKFGMAGVVQHGASTLQDSEFHKFPDAGACEIHLATGFQNMVFDHPALPQELRQRIVAWVKANLASEKKEKDTVEQFVYKSRKKAYGPFKRELWELTDDARDAIMADLEAKFAFLFETLRVTDTKDLAAKYAIVDPAPPTLGAGRVAAGIEMAADEGE